MWLRRKFCDRSVFVFNFCDHICPTSFDAGGTVVRFNHTLIIKINQFPKFTKWRKALMCEKAVMLNCSAIKDFWGMKF